MFGVVLLVVLGGWGEHTVFLSLKRLFRLYSYHIAYFQKLMLVPERQLSMADQTQTQISFAFGNLSSIWNYIGV